MRTSRPTAALALLSFTAYACGEPPTAGTPHAVADDRRFSLRDTAPITCTYSHPDETSPGSYRYGWVRFHVPKSVVGGDPRIRTFKVYFERAREAPWGIVNCDIPNSPALIEYLKLRVAGGKGRTASRPPDWVSASYATTMDLPPVIVIAPPPWDWGPPGWDGGGSTCNWYYEWCPDSSQGDRGGGGYVEPPPPPEPICNPNIDPVCEQPFTAADTAALNTSTQNFVRPPSTIADTAHRRQCQELVNKVNGMFAAGLIFRGAYKTTQTDTIKDGDDHYGAYNPNTGHIHVEAFVLDSAAMGLATWQYVLARNLMHESAHALNYHHPNGVNPYTDPPFNLLTPDANSCLQ